MKLFVNQKPSSEAWREQIYSGAMYLWTRLQSTQQLGDFAEECIKKHLGGINYMTDYLEWPVETFIEKASALKGHFTNCQEVKEIIRDFVVEIGERPDQYLFDVPRLRVVPNSDYLSTGVSYNYSPHRDTWYGAPACQINFWMPIFSVQSDTTMPMYPAYFSQAVRNSSDRFDVKHWNEVERPAAVHQVSSDTRRHPLPKEALDPNFELLLAGGRGDALVFSGDHLHSSQTNRNKEIRFSTDFRLYFEPDLSSGLGAERIDDNSANKDYYLTDLFKVSNFSKFL